ncbi:MAG: hypothetical protein AB1635_08015 [Acidobacteriota bacterium]
MSAVLLVHFGATLLLTGLIWFVQVVHYPLFASVGHDAFARYEERHTARTTWVVAPLMIAEAATALWLSWSPPPGTAPLAWIGAALLAAIWLSTFLVQVPAHRRLAAGFDAAVHARLVRTNWIRTVAWTMRTMVVSAWSAAG